MGFPLFKVIKWAQESYLNSLWKSEPHTVNVIITDITDEVSMDIEMLNVLKQRHTSKQEKDINMVEALEKGHPLDKLDPLIIEFE